MQAALFWRGEERVPERCLTSLASEAGSSSDRRSRAVVASRRSRSDGYRCAAPSEAPLLPLVRPHRDQRAQQEHQAGEPDQVDERVDERLDHDRAVAVELLADQEQVLGPQPVGADADLVRDLLLDWVAVLAGEVGAEASAVAGDGQASADLHAVRLPPRLRAEVAEIVAADAHRLAGLELARLRGAVRAARDPEREQDDGGVDDVAAVAAAVAAHQRREGAEPGCI